MGGSGSLAAFVTGLTVENMKCLRLGQHDEHAVLLKDFVSQVSEIAVLMVFATSG